MSSGLKFVARPNEERGHADHEWLKTFHTFSFAMYLDPKHTQHGCLRVINEDRVLPETGFGTHGHREFEIFSYVVSGNLEHKDSMGNIEVLKRGDIQLTSAGTGITHSEYTHGSQPVHFLQIWSLPSTKGLKPKYFTRHFTDDEKKDTLVRVVAPIKADGVVDSREGTGPAPVQSPLTLYASLLSPSKALSHTFERSKGYIHVVQTSGYNTGKSQGNGIRISGENDQELVLKEGDGAYIWAEAGKSIKIENVGDGVAEVLLFDTD